MPARLAVEIVYYVAASLDGFIATQDGAVQWLAPFEAADEDYGYAEFYASIDALLLGSRTYEQSLTFGDWPYSGKPCWVFSQRRLAVARPEVTVTTQSPMEVVAELEARGFRRAWLVGGGKLAASFRAAGLITEYIVSLIPVILGAGIPLLGDPGSQERLRLIGISSYDNGVLQLHYVPVDDA